MNASKKFDADTTWTAEIADWRNQVYVPEYPYGPGTTWNRQGVQSLVDEAKAYFEEVSGVDLPYNLSTHGPWVDRSWRNKLVEGREEMVAYAARFAGWLKKVAELPGFVRLIERTTSPRGMNSPYTELWLYSLFNRFPSPHAVERKYWKVLRRANQILEPYGLSVSYAGLAEALTGRNARRTGKAARVATEETVAQYTDYRFGERLNLIQARGLRDAVAAPAAVRHWAANRVEAGEFGSLREAMAHADRLVPDNSDGVELLLDLTTTVTVHGVDITVGWGEDGMPQELCRQRHTWRTYHGSAWYDRDPRSLAKEAIRAWRQREKLAATEAKLIGFLRGEEGFCPLVYRDDSYRSGNCQSGTEAWLRRQGWEDKPFIPAQWLIPHLDYGLVRNVAKAVFAAHH